jgi:hypothetical protein
MEDGRSKQKYLIYNALFCVFFISVPAMKSYVITRPHAPPSMRSALLCQLPETGNFLSLRFKVYAVLELY